MSEQSLPRSPPVAAQGCLHRETLVGGDVLDETEELRGERRLRQRGWAAGVDACRKLDNVVCRKTGEGPVVANVDHLDVAGSRGQRGDEPCCGLAVEGTATPLEQRRLFGQPRIAVELEQL